MLRQLTFSKLELAEHCQHWRTLDYTDEASPDAIEGKRKHAVAQAYIERGTTVDEDWFATWRKWWEKNKPGGAIACEVKFAYDPIAETARILTSEGERDYSEAKPHELVGTSDLVATIPSVLALVWDWKTGKKLVHGAADSSLQLGAGAVCACALNDCAEANVAYQYVRKTVRTDAAKLNATKLNHCRARLRSIALDTTEPQPGNHCTDLYCPGRHTCDAYREAHGLPKAKQAQHAQETRKETAMGTMSLKNVRKGPINEPHRILLYGVEGVGKSTFGFHSPNPIFLASERGTAELDAARFPEPGNWPAVIEAIEELKSEHDYQTLVIDTVDWLEPILHAWLCKENDWDSIEAPSYGKGYVAAADEWRELLVKLNEIQDLRRINVIFLGHCVARSHRHPELDDFDRFELSINKKAAALLKQWCRTVLFCDYETETFEKNKRTRAIDSGARLIHTQWRAAFDAKNRLGLPPTIPLSWDDFAAACAAAKKPTNATVLATIKKLVASFEDEELTKKVMASVKSAGNDPAKLASIVNRLQAKKQQQAAA